MLLFKIFVCSFYGLVSTLQTLNSRYLFKTLGFNFYSTVFLLQRLVILLLHNNLQGQAINWGTLQHIIPYSLLMCFINMLSSFCVTIMPLAAFMAFKKFVVLFVLLLGLFLHLPNSFNKVHYYCIGVIVVGGVMIGQKDVFHGDFLGYLSSLLYTLLQAVTLQYSSYLFVNKGIGPKGSNVIKQIDLMAANSLISLPCYLFFIIYNDELPRIFIYCSQPTSSFLFETICLALALSVASEYTANTITMRISPFEKASISNIKDMLLTIISLLYYKDFALTFVSLLGVVLCLSASLIFSFTIIQKSQQQSSVATAESIDSNHDLDASTLKHIERQNN